MSRRLNLKDKMQEINQRFSMKNKTTIANDVLQNKLINIKKKLTSFYNKNQQQMTQIKSQALQLLKRVQHNNALYEQEAQNQLRQLEQLSSQLNTKIQSQIQERKDKENQLIQTMEKKLKFLKMEIEKQKRQRIQVMQQITSTLKNDVPLLMNQVIDNASARQDQQDKLVEIINVELGQCSQKTKQFKEQQETSCSKIYGLIRQLTLKAKKQIQEQKIVRQQTHDELLSYIEETCNKIV